MSATIHRLPVAALPPTRLHPVTESILRGLNGSCNLIEEDLDIEDDPDRVFATYQWVKAIAARMNGLVDQAGRKMNTMGERR